jgi:hypothetical protein
MFARKAFVPPGRARADPQSNHAVPHGAEKVQPAASQGSAPAHGVELDREVRESAERRLGFDLRHVRIHADAGAADAAAAVGAGAFTLGKHVAFAQGAYQPHTAAGRELLQHELVHVVQQASASDGDRFALGAPGDAFEREADTLAKSPQTMSPRLRTNGRRLQKAPPPAKGLDAPPASSQPTVLVLGLYNREVFPGSGALPMQDNLIRQARQATGLRPLMMGGMKSFKGKEVEGRKVEPSWAEVAPSGLASSRLIQEALEGGGKENFRAVYIDTAGVNLLERHAEAPRRGDPVAAAAARAAHPEGTSQTGAEYRSVVAALASGTHKVDIYIRHAGGLSVVRAGKQEVEGSPLPANLRPHLPPSFKTGTPSGGAPPQQGPAGTGRPPSAGPQIEEPPPTVREGRLGQGPREPQAPTAARRSVPPIREPRPSGARSESQLPKGAPTSAPPGAAGKGEVTAYVPSRPPLSIGPGPRAAIGQGSVLAIQAIHAALSYFADKDQRDKAQKAYDAERPAIEKALQSGQGVLVFFLYTQARQLPDAPVTPAIKFEGIRWQVGGRHQIPPDVALGPGETPQFATQYIPPPKASPEGRLENLWERVKAYQRAGESMAQEGPAGRFLRSRTQSKIDLKPIYDARSHLSSATKAIKQERIADAQVSMDAAEELLDRMRQVFVEYTGKTSW